MIFVTVGTYAFEELVQAVDEAVAGGNLGPDVVIQIGNGVYQPRHCAYFRSAPRLAPYYEEADLVVGHGGTGTVLEVLERGLPLVGVANPHLSDHHQHEFLSALAGQGYLWYCHRLEQLVDYIDSARCQRMARCPQRNTRFGIGTQLEQATPRERAVPRHSWCWSLLRRWSSRSLEPIRIPPNSLRPFPNRSQERPLVTSSNLRANLWMRDLALDQERLLVPQGGIEMV